MDSLRDIYKAILRNLDPARRVAPNDNTLNILRQICEALGIKWRTHDSLRDLWKKIAESIGIRITRSDSIYDILYKIAQQARPVNRHEPYPRLLIVAGSLIAQLSPDGSIIYDGVSLTYNGDFLIYTA